MFFFLIIYKFLTDHFLNSLSEKTTNDTPMKYSQRHFRSTFYQLPFSNHGIYLQIIHVRQKSVFYVLPHVHRLR